MELPPAQTEAADDIQGGQISSVAAEEDVVGVAHDESIHPQLPSTVAENSESNAASAPTSDYLGPVHIITHDACLLHDVPNHPECPVPPYLLHTSSPTPIFAARKN